eukprot:GDKH01002096.1.p1 GENE.GDKH01002096.1~~GDKH01002096.1.p1  ORF type:complete len:214 (-),score=29.97 GDKH01002096.1:328-969(-)
MMMLRVFLLAVLACVAFAHPHYYPEPTNEDGVSICNSEDEEASKRIVYNSFHIHVLFWGSNKNHTSGALALRDRFLEAFDLTKPEHHCASLLHQNASCFFYPDMEAAGPFVVAQWSIYVVPKDIVRMSEWITKRRGSYDVLIHPNSGCNIRDHVHFPVWSGKPWPIDATIFKRLDKPDDWRVPDENGEVAPFLSYKRHALGGVGVFKNNFITV